MIAAIAGPAGAAAKAWARRLETELLLTNANENPLFDALAAANAGPAEPMAADAPKSYLATGAGNYYVRGGPSGDAVSGVFQCSRRRVDDHQHNDAGNWVLTRGADDLVVDPSPYGSLSSLTGNAPSIDSKVLPAGYSPSQAGWGTATRLVWAKQWSSGVAAGRCDYADQFRTESTASDVSSALRDFVFVPNGPDGTVVLVDRAVTGDASRALHLRVRTPMDLTQSDANVARGTTGTSSLTIQKVWPAAVVGGVRAMPQTPECSSSNRACDISRLAAGMEYRADLAGPSAIALHVVDAQSAAAAAPANVLLAGSGYRGVLVERGENRVAVVTNDTPEGTPSGPLVYRVPAGSGALHVVLDAPVGASGQSDVTGASDGADCVVTVTARADSSGGFEGRPLVLRTTSGCNVVAEGTQGPVDPGPQGPSGAGGGVVGTTTGAGGSSDVGGASTGNAGSAGAGSSPISATVGANGSVGTDPVTTTGSSQPSHGAGDVRGSCALRDVSGDAKRWPLLALAAGWMFARHRRSRSRSRPERVGEPSHELARFVADQ